MSSTKLFTWAPPLRIRDTFLIQNDLRRAFQTEKLTRNWIRRRILETWLPTTYDRAVARENSFYAACKNDHLSSIECLHASAHVGSYNFVLPRVNDDVSMTSRAGPLCRQFFGNLRVHYWCKGALSLKLIFLPLEHAGRYTVEFYFGNCNHVSFT